MRRRSKFGWMELMIGILLIVLGIFTFLRPGSVLTGAVLVYGVFALIGKYKCINQRKYLSKY